MLGIGRIRRLVHDRKVRAAHQAHRRQHAADFPPLDAILDKFHSAGGLKHDYQAYKLFSLRRLLGQWCPKRILELGSGSSTAVFADYVRRAGGELWSYDESAEWLENSRKISAIERDDPRFHLVHSEKRIVRRDGVPVEIGFEIPLPSEHFDMVLIDGPSLRADGQRYKQAINPDIFQLTEELPPAVILVDIRSATVDALAERLCGRYVLERSDVLTGSIAPGYRYFSEFRRSD